ncbi:MAG: leucine-rich repeat domain-containing protein [Oscillospiraceae bacterium]|nr:leucine-rich repeat domain-containing protein [Oscillospiraceae bacterium]
MNKYTDPFDKRIADGLEQTVGGIRTPENWLDGAPKQGEVSRAYRWRELAASAVSVAAVLALLLGLGWWSIFRGREPAVDLAGDDGEQIMTEDYKSTEITKKRPQTAKESGRDTLNEEKTSVTQIGESTREVTSTQVAKESGENDLDEEKTSGTRIRESTHEVTSTKAVIIDSIQESTATTVIVDPSEQRVQYEYKIVDDGVIITGHTWSGYPFPDILPDFFFYNDKNFILTIPDTIEGKPVIGIGDYAFAPNIFTRIIIPDSVKSIGKNVFDWTLSLKYINIPKNVIFIDKQAFSGLYYFESISVATDNPYYSDMDGVLFNKDKSEILCYPLGREENSYILPENLTKISEGAFSGCKLENIILPDNLVVIERAAFYNTKIGEIIIPDKIVNIGQYTFAGCKNLQKIIIPNSVMKIDETAFDNSDDVVIHCYADSYALAYAIENDIPYQIIA